jgi:hypothetical protein
LLISYTCQASATLKKPSPRSEMPAAPARSAKSRRARGWKMRIRLRRARGGIGQARGV